MRESQFADSQTPLGNIPTPATQFADSPDSHSQTRTLPEYRPTADEVGFGPTVVARLRREHGTVDGIARWMAANTTDREFVRWCVTILDVEIAEADWPVVTAILENDVPEAFVTLHRDEYDELYRAAETAAIHDRARERASEALDA
jgi:hypothetical protein